MFTNITLLLKVQRVVFQFQIKYQQAVFTNKIKYHQTKLKDIYKTRLSVQELISSKSLFRK
jgi:hypothetical protein